jgi:hypothetical protein
MDAHCKKINANYEEMRADMNAYYEKMDAYYDREEARMDAYYEGMIAIIKECLGRTEAKKESTPKETETVGEPQEVPEGATDAKAIGAAKDRSRDLRLAVGCRGHLKTRTKRDGRLRQECAATVGRPTRRFVPALRKGGIRKGPVKECRRSGIRVPGRTLGNRMTDRGLKK